MTGIGSVVIREMTEHDLPTVVRLENASFTSPWQLDTFRTLVGRPGAVLRVVEVEGVVVAYAVLWCILDQGELANIAVDPGFWGRGLGGRLLDHLLDVGRERGVESLFLEVRESNAVARAMYGRRGFEQVGLRRDYYDDPREDALVLRKHL